MPHYCAYSFKDLFTAANGREWTAAENAELSALDQETRNIRVRELAKQAGWKVKDVTSWEGDVYTAFWPGNTTNKS